MTTDQQTAIRNPFPVLPPLQAWEDTVATVHMWLQVVGKVRLECSPWINHSWGSVLYVTPRGLTTSPIPYEGRTFAIDFDFLDHTLRFTTSEGAERSIALEPMSVADFYHDVMDALTALGIEVEILTRPVEVEEAIPFEDDTEHDSYDGEAMQRFWRALVQSDRVFKRFREGFIGKASPVHFFWGGFDMAATRFSGRTAPKHPGGVPNTADWVMEEAYSHELWSAGFWPGPGFGKAAFYAYAYPEPTGFREQLIEPEGAYYHDTLGEYILPYEAVQTAEDPDTALFAFLRTTYEAAANLANWDRAALERAAPSQHFSRSNRVTNHGRPRGQD